MSIAEEIARLQQAKADLKASINAKGGTITDETIDEYASKVSALPSPKEEQTKTVSPTTSIQEVLPDANKVLSKVTVNAIPTETKSQQPNLSSGNQTIYATSGKFMTSFTITKDTVNHIASNIRSGITLYGVTGNLQPAKEEETKTVTPNFSSGNVVVTPTSGKVMTQVTINKDSNLIADNIKKDITVHGITGTLQQAKEEQTKTVSPTTSSQDVLPDANKVLSKVTVNAIPTETKSQQPNLASGNQTINATSGKFMTSFTITKDITNHIASNIRSGKTLYGVTGNLQPAKEEETKTVTPNFSSGNVVVTPTSGKVLSQVTINKDSNLIADNIKKDVTVHGITGTLESGGGISLTNLPFFEYTVGTGTNNKVMYLLVSAMLHNGHNDYYSGITVKNSSDNAIFNIKSDWDGRLRISTDGGSSWTPLDRPLALIKLNLKDTIKPYLEYFNETPYPLTIYKYLDIFGRYDYGGTPSAIVQVEPVSGKYYFEEINLWYDFASFPLYFLIVNLKSVYWD